MGEEEIKFEAQPSERLAGEIYLESAFLIERVATAFVIIQTVDGHQRYATLQWHEKKPGQDIHEYTLLLDLWQARQFMERLRAVTSDTPAGRKDAEESRFLAHRVDVLERENELLR